MTERQLMLTGVMGIWTRSDKEVPPPSSHRWAMSLGVLCPRARLPKVYSKARVGLDSSSLVEKKKCVYTKYDFMTLTCAFG